MNLNNGHHPIRKAHKFHFLDMVRVVKKTSGIIDLAGPNVEKNAFFEGALGRVIDYTPKGYKVHFPIPNFPDQAFLIDITEEVLVLERVATEEEHYLAHRLPLPVKAPALPGVVPTRG